MKALGASNPVLQCDVAQCWNGENDGQAGCFRLFSTGTASRVSTGGDSQKKCSHLHTHSLVVGMVGTTGASRVRTWQRVVEQ